MTKVQRVENIFVAFFLILLSVILFLASEEGYLVVFGFLAVSWLIQSVRLLLYYITMARFMVDGRRVLIKGVIFLDLAIIAASLDDIPRIYVMIYLVAGLIFANVVEIFRSIDAKKHGSHRWEVRFIAGIIGIVLAFYCMINFNNPVLTAYIYAVELIWSALVRIANAFKKTSVVYIK